MEHNSNIPLYDSVSVIYYPIQRDYDNGHAELEVEGLCYSAVEIPGQTQAYPLSKKIARAEQGGCPFFVCKISVTPQQLSAIKLDLKTRVFSSTCMHEVSKILADSADFSIPLPISISPAASYHYLRYAQSLGHKRIVRIDSHPETLSPNLQKRVLAAQIFESGGLFLISCLILYVTASLIHDFAQKLIV